MTAVTGHKVEQSCIEVTADRSLDESHPQGTDIHASLHLKALTNIDFFTSCKNMAQNFNSGSEHHV